ncbi:MAG: hypothetical protein K1X94_05340 [Sandaracinaceae bacterium]|nr:hypothetical protein [Sandaracinaceae bacterium]
MLVLTTEPDREGGLPRVTAVLAPAEIDALLSGSTERFVVTIDGRDLEVEVLAASTSPTTPKPSVRLRIADDALRASRAGTVTPLFPADIPFVLSLMCSEPATGPVKVAPGVTYERIDLRAASKTPTTPASTSPAQRSQPTDAAKPWPLHERILIGLGAALFFGVVGSFRGDEAPIYWLVGIGTGLYAVFGKDLRRG